MQRSFWIFISTLGLFVGLLFLATMMSPASASPARPEREMAPQARQVPGEAPAGSAGPPRSIALAGERYRLPMGSRAVITATVKDASGLPVPDYQVTFTTTLGSIPPTATTNEQGVATTTWQAGETLGRATILAIAGEAHATIEIEIEPGLTFLPIVRTPPTIHRMSLESSQWISGSNNNEQPQSIFQPGKLLLGNDDLNSCRDGLPNPGNWRVRSSALSRPANKERLHLLIYFKLFTLDQNTAPISEGMDYFQFQVIGDQSSSTPRLFANQEREAACTESPPEPLDFLLNETFELGDNSRVMIDLLVTNRFDKSYNTWVEITDIYYYWE